MTTATLTAAAVAGLSPERQHPLSELEPAWPDAADRWAGEQCRDRQRWVAGNWLLGYNTFTTTCWKTTCNVPGWAQRRGVKTCACRPLLPAVRWLAAAFRHPRAAHGARVRRNGQSPASRFHHLNTSVSFEQYFGDNVDLFNSGTGYHNPVAVNPG